LFRKAYFRACFLLAFISPTLLISREAAAQDPIRVQSAEVLVPTVVFDKAIYAQLNKMKPHRRDSYGHLVAKNEKLWDSIAVKGLTEKDFHLFEDGVEQRIERARLEPPAFRVVEDSLGKHPEIVGSGGGLWAYPDTPQTDMRVWLAWPQYVLAYAPAKSPAGSCHQIQVKVDRTNLEVWTRSEYCSTDHPASDPLNGTEFGKQLEANANPRTLSAIDLQMQVWAFADNTDVARVYVSIDFPWQTLRCEFRDGTLYATVGSLVMVYRKDGTLAARYSDFACCDYGIAKKSSASERQAESQHVTTQTPGAEALLPDRYETQFALPPGEYQVRAVLSDGVHFGVQEAPLTAASYDATKLGISDVVLSRRARKVPAEATEAAAQVANSYTPLISKGVEFTPTPNPRFLSSDMLFAYFEINDPLAHGQPGTKVQVNMRIEDKESGTQVDAFAAVDVTTYSKAASPLIAVARGVPLKGLTPGVYRLEVQASNAEGKSTDWRAAVFRVIEAPPLELSETPPPKKEEVILNVTALDSKGRPVTDLTSADFQIVEDVGPRAITSFRVTSAQPSPGTRPPPIVILFDLMNTHWSRREYVANRIIKVLNPLETDVGIYLYLLTADGELRPVRPHGTGQAAAIEQGSIAGRWDAEKLDDTPWTKMIRPRLTQAISEVRGFREEDYQTEAWRAPLTFRRLSELEDDFSAVRGPKTLLWITGGVPVSVRSSCQNNVISSATGTYASGTCSGACQLPNAAGISAILGTCMDYTPFLVRFGTEAAAADTRVASVALTATGLQDFDVGNSAYSLARLADLTGGQVYMNTDADLEKAIQEAVVARNPRYRLTFAASVGDGKYHKLQVLCTREGARVVGPRGYFAVAPRQQPQRSSR
jgi:VWFA-related protein